MTHLIRFGSLKPFDQQAQIAFSEVWALKVGYTVLLTDLDLGNPLWDCHNSMPFCLMVGNEDMR